MFKGLGILVAVYTLYAISQGEAFAKSGAWGNTISRANSPKCFWMLIAVYALMSVALIKVF